MATFTISGAARAVGTSRGTIQRAIKTGRLSATTNEQGERVIDLVELLRVFGPLKTTEQGEQPASSTAVQRETGGEQGDTVLLIEVLREQLRAAQEDKARLLALLEAEQSARRDLEQRLLPAPPPAPQRPHHRLAALLVILVVAVVAMVWARASGG